MNNYSQVLVILNDNNIKFERYFVIDNLFYICFLSELSDKEQEQIKMLFAEADYFKSYKQFCIDMNKQIKTPAITEKQARKYTKREVDEKKQEMINIEKNFALDNLPTIKSLFNE